MLIPKTPDNLPIRSVASKEFFIKIPRPPIPTAPTKAVLKLNTALVNPPKPFLTAPKAFLVLSTADI